MSKYQPYALTCCFAWFLHTTTVNKKNRILVQATKGKYYMRSPLSFYLAANIRLKVLLPILLFVMSLLAPLPISAGTWTETNGLLKFARGSGFSATLLSNGKVLVAGGLLFDTALSDCHLYDPVSGDWVETGSLNYTRFKHTATLLKDGRVLVAGGSGPYSAYRNSAEIYDPDTGIWTETATTMAVERLEHSATLLANGQVLIAGGTNDFPPIDFYLDTCELYDPATDSWAATGSPP